MDNSKQLITKTKEIVEILSKKLVKSGWYDALRLFLISSDMEAIIDKLIHEAAEGHRFFPKTQDMFRFLSECPVSKLKAVILTAQSSGQGIPFARIDDKDRDNGTLEKIYDSLQEYRPEGELKPSWDKTMTCWSNQGCLLLPYSPTWRTLASSHQHIWVSFIARIIEKIEELHPDIPWLIMDNEFHPEGKASQYKEILTSPNIRVCTMQSVNHLDMWWVNECIVANGGQPVKW